MASNARVRSFYASIVLQKLATFHGVSIALRVVSHAASAAVSLSPLPPHMQRRWRQCARNRKRVFGFRVKTETAAALVNECGAAEEGRNKSSRRESADYTEGVDYVNGHDEAELRIDKAQARDSLQAFLHMLANLSVRCCVKLAPASGDCRMAEKRFCLIAPFLFLTLSAVPTRHCCSQLSFFIQG